MQVVGSSDYSHLLSNLTTNWIFSWSTPFKFDYLLEQIPELREMLAYIY